MTRLPESIPVEKWPDISANAAAQRRFHLREDRRTREANGVLAEVAFKGRRESRRFAPG